MAMVIQERRLEGLQDTDVDMLAFMMRSQEQVSVFLYAPVQTSGVDCCTCHSAVNFLGRFL